MLSHVLIALTMVSAQPSGPSAGATPPGPGTTPTPTAKTNGATERKALPPIITLYTMGRGELMVEKFGHAALCVKYRAGIKDLGRMCEFPSKVPPPAVMAEIRKLWVRLVNWDTFKSRISAVDPAWVPGAFCVWRHRVALRGRSQSVCYNYGTTDFSDPIGLGWGFLRGRSKFWVDPQFFSQLYRIYSMKDRSLFRQVLPLPAEKAWATARRLEHDVLEENKYYNYHHFYDNCTTRVRDIVNDAVGGKLKVDTDKKMGLTFREYGAKGFAESTWLLAISDFVFGRGGDVEPTLWQAMFLPRIMRDEVEQRLGVKPVQIYKRKGGDFAYDQGNMGRAWTFLIALLLSLPLLVSVIWGRFPRFGLWLSTVTLTLVSITLWMLAAVSTLYELRVNEACLLFWPSDGALPFLSERKRIKYARIRVAGLVLVSMFLVVGLFKQPLWMPILFAFIPLFALSRLWELVPQVAARTEQKAQAASGKGNGKAKDDGEDGADDKKSKPNVAAMQSKKSKKSKKRKRARR